MDTIVLSNYLYHLFSWAVCQVNLELMNSLWIENANIYRAFFLLSASDDSWLQVVGENALLHSQIAPDWELDLIVN